MLKRVSGVALVFVILVVALSVSGCEVKSEELTGKVAEAYKAQTGKTDVKGVGANPIEKDTNDSHRMMTEMLLSGAGMDSNLDSYTSVWLVDMKKDDGTEFKAVIADGKVALPQNLDEQ